MRTELRKNQEARRGHAMNSPLLTYYEAIERASADMLSAARAGDWDLVVRLEGACGLLISQLKQAARGETLQPADAQARTRIMKRILLRDAEIRHLAEPWLDQIDLVLAGKGRTLH
jgi:flagellar protein FliT